ncbi:serine hydrolase [Polyangium sp. 6x1]|uniref:serine hydrolase domain-containing protein n=1 Tax=Polyangium sp. 6x1 TaxID=3042689 RepID=UPI002482E612|nr:serine hydrolase [Polyangium sp. 6x1]MDI1444337.1 serine hydrolase [Polyangium sp. 6x1]
MRSLFVTVLLAAIGCTSPDLSPKAPVAKQPAPVAVQPAAVQPAAVQPASAQTLSADTPSKTAAGHTFIAPAGWSLRENGNAVILEAPEGGSWIALVDAQAKDAEAALAEAWAAYRPDAEWPLRSTWPTPNKDGWQDQRTYTYQTSPNELRTVTARTMRHGDRWTVRISDMANAVAGKREAQLALVFDQLLPKGYVRETFAGRKAHKLDAARVAELEAFITRAQQTLSVPGISIGVVQDGEVVFAGGFGVRELGKQALVDADTTYLIASNTKSLTTLMLGKLVDEGKLSWETPVTTLLPEFKLGDPDTTSKVQVKHLLCACTGLPRHDLEWLLGPAGATPALALTILGRMQPTSKFGEMYQYSNPIAAAAGLVGGHVAFPGLELGAAYDQVMATRVFGPLGMTRTTFDFARAMRDNYARPYAFDVDGKIAPVAMALNTPIRAVRPAGGAWSTVRDLLKYVQMELAKGALPGGKRYVSEAILAARQAPQVKTGKDSWYGMGLDVDTSSGTPMVFHGGRMRGYRSNMVWLPEHGVGAVILTNADSGNVLMDAFPRKLLEVLFDGRPQADDTVTVSAKASQEWIAASRKLLSIPPDQGEVEKLASRYRSDVLGEIRVTKTGEGATFDFGTWKAPIASRKNPDGTITFVATAASWSPEFVASAQAGRRTLKIRDAQHEYVFTESD